MERKGKGKEEREDKFGPLKNREKLKKGGMVLVVGKRGGPSTPSPTWRLECSSVSPNLDKNNNHPVQEFLHTNRRVTARKLCANSWEVQPQLYFELHGISNKCYGTSKRGVRAPRGRQGANQDSELKLKDILVDLPSSSRPDQLPGVSMSGKQFETPQVQDHSSIERFVHPSMFSSPTTHSSSLKIDYSPGTLCICHFCNFQHIGAVAPCNHAIIPTSSLDFKGKKVEPSNKIKTSTELLKVLNNIWSLEEQHALNISLQKSLKLEIEDSHLKIRELLKERKKNWQELDILRKEAVKDKAYVKSWELDHVEAAVQLAQQELRDEWKLRKQSETLHQKLARKFSKVQSSFFLALKEVEQERKDRILLEKLCDEFAHEIKDYEHEVRSLRHKAEMDHSGLDKLDRLVLHISEAWLDGRMQMELAEAQCRPGEKDNIAHKLRLDLETFLQARRSSGSRKRKTLPANKPTQNSCKRESFPLNGSSSAPKDGACEENSSDSDLHCLEQTKSASKGQNILIRSEQPDSRLNPSNIQVQLGQSVIFKERKQFPGEGKRELRLENQMGAGNIGRADAHKARQEVLTERNSKWLGNHSPYSNFRLNDCNRIYSMSEGDGICPVSDIKEEAYILLVSKGPTSPVKQWMPKLTSPKFDKAESSSQLPANVKENTLKAKLLEARMEDRRSRLKANKTPPQVLIA